MKGIQCCGDCAGYDRKNKKCGYAPIESIIEEHFYKACPLPDVVEVKHGEWIRQVSWTDGHKERRFGYVCSECYGVCEKNDYCGRCGARMDGEMNA